ncbi:MAG: MBL fold metallo-hydrolase, partial [Spirochaetales bacterium]|nr:MBL fold metallo-hydrolase [Spirochaetales bacterium]
GEDGAKLLENLDSLQVSLSAISDIVISHDHWDHQGGLWALLEKRPGINVYSCSGFSQEFKDKVKGLGGKLIELAGLTEISTGIYSTGEIIGSYDGDPISEQVMLCNTPKGLSVITGCAHPGIISIVDKAMELFPDQDLNTLMGGFHLYKSSEKEAETVYIKLKKYGFKSYGGTHCTGDYAKRFNTFEIAAGSRIVF